MRVVILNPGIRLKNWRKICIFPGSNCMDAPFFWKRQYIEWLQKSYLIFPWRSPLMTYYPPNECKYRNYSLFCEMGGFWNKGRTPGERWPKCLQWTQLFSKIATWSITVLAEEKIVFQNTKFSKITLIWPYFAREHPINNFSSQISEILEKFEFWKTIFSKTSTVVYPRFLTRINGFIPDILVTFPLAFDPFLKYPPYAQNNE